MLKQMQYTFAVNFGTLSIWLLHQPHVLSETSLILKRITAVNSSNEETTDSWVNQNIVLTISGMQLGDILSGLKSVRGDSTDSGILFACWMLEFIGDNSGSNDSRVRPEPGPCFF